MKIFPIILLFFYMLLLFACESNKSEAYIVQMNDERVIVIDNDKHVASFFTKNGLLINRINLTTMQSQKIDLTLSLNDQIHSWNDTIFVKAELIGDKLYWNARTSGINTRNASHLSLNSYGGMEIYLCQNFCNWNPVYNSETEKTTHHHTSGVVKDVTLEEFSNIKILGFRAQSRR